MIKLMITIFLLSFILVANEGDEIVEKNVEVIEENLGEENQPCIENQSCNDGLFCEENICKKKDSSMDFSEVIVESDRVDDDAEKEEEKAILKSLKDKRKKIKTSSFKKKKKKKTNFLEFFPLYLDISYLNMSTLDIPNNHNLAVEFGFSFFSIVLSNVNFQIGRVAIAPTYKWGLSAWEISPLSLSYQLNHHVHKFLFELEFYKTYTLFKKFRVQRNRSILMWNKFISLKSSWFLLKMNDKDIKLFFETALVAGNHRDSNTGVSFSLGISGSFSPLQFTF